MFWCREMLKISYLNIEQGMSLYVCPLHHISQNIFIQSTSYLADVQLGTKGSAVPMVKLFE